MALLTRDAILAAGDIKSEDVDVPEWGGTVRVAVMSGTARDAWEQALVIREGAKSRPNLANVRARLVAATVVDEAGAPLFSAADVAALGAKSAAALDRVCNVSQRLNGLGTAALESAAGNSAPGPSAPGTSN